MAGRQLTLAGGVVDAGAGRVNDQFAALRHRVPGVDRQVDQDLLDLTGVGQYERKVGGQVGDQLDVLAEGADQQLLDAQDDVVDVEYARLDQLLAGERQQLAGQPGGLLGGLLDLPDVVADGLPALIRCFLGDFFAGEGGVVGDDAEQVVEVVGHPAITWPSRPTSPTAPYSRQPSSMPPLLCREPLLTSDPGHGPPCGHQPALSVLFTPTDTTDYNTSSASVRFNVAKATPTITWANPAVPSTAPHSRPPSSTPHRHGQSPESREVYRATSPSTPAAATVLPVGTGQTLSVTFAASDPVDYSTASASVPITVLDRVGTIEFSSPAAGYAVPENAGSATITVNRVNGARGIVKVDYQTVPINATPGLDFTPVSGTLTFPTGVTSETIVVPVLPNPYDHRNELVSVVLSNLQSTETLGQPILGSPSTATLTIQDIDPDFNPLVVNSVQWTGTAQGITQIFVTFSKPLIASTCLIRRLLRSVNVGPDGKYGTRRRPGRSDDGGALPIVELRRGPDPGPSTA